jgi:hypothetical protein
MVMGSKPRRTRDRTFLQLAAFAAIGGLGAIGTSIFTVVLTWRAGHPNSTFFFFSLWGLAALAGAAANVVVYFQSGDPPDKPPRGGQKVVQLRSLEAASQVVQADQDRKAA